MIAIVRVIEIISWRNRQAKITKTKSRPSRSSIEIDVGKRFLFKPPSGNYYQFAVSIRISQLAVTARKSPVGQVNPKMPSPMKVSMSPDSRAEFKSQTATHSHFDPPRPGT
jgi:hypothetical protein